MIHKIYRTSQSQSSDKVICTLWVGIVFTLNLNPAIDALNLSSIAHYCLHLLTLINTLLDKIMTLQFIDLTKKCWDPNLDNRQNT